MERILQVMGGMNRRGAETFIMNVYRKINHSVLQFDFLVYDMARQDYEDEIESLGGRVIHMPCHTGLKAPLSISQFRKVLRENGPYKAVHIQTLLNSVWPLIAVKSETPDSVRIVHSHNTGNTLSSGFIKRIYERFARIMIRRHTQTMLACGQEAGEYLFGDKFIQAGIVVNNGIDLDYHTAKNANAIKAIRKEFDLERCLVIGSVARFNPIKNHTRMINIASELRKQGVGFKMLFVGNGSDEEMLREKVKDAGLSDHIIFTGLRRDIRDLMATFDVFLMTSHFEGNPVTLVEAQATGTPCVVSDVITNNMDMGLGLISKCSLESSDEIWAETILRASAVRQEDIIEIRQQLTAHGYDSESTARQLTSIYLK